MHDAWECLDPAAAGVRCRLAVFDFDGTLSLVRGNWQALMSRQMIETLRAAGADEPDDTLAAQVAELIHSRNGRPTIHQMRALAEEVARRGARPMDPRDYQQRYESRLLEQVHAYYADLRTGRRRPDDLTVPGARALLDRLRAAGVTLALLSGTARSYVLADLAALGLDAYFADAVYAPGPDDETFSKADVLAALLARLNGPAEGLVSLGDGPIETAAARQHGARAVGVASRETLGAGPDPVKRSWLLRAGAQAIVPDLRPRAELLAWLGVR